MGRSPEAGCLLSEFYAATPGVQAATIQSRPAAVPIAQGLIHSLKIFNIRRFMASYRKDVSIKKLSKLIQRQG
jgi:hypothetical protein